MSKVYHRNNFFKHTFCEWQLVDGAFITAKKPDYKSKSGSSYYFDSEGLYRYSNHWGRAANCRWRLISGEKTSQGFYLGYAKWTDFYPNNDTDLLYFIVMDWDSKTARSQHREKSADTHFYRTASDTAKRIQTIQEVLTTTAWAKYVDYDDMEELRQFVIKLLVSSGLHFNEIKKRWNYGEEK